LDVLQTDEHLGLRPSAWSLLGGVRVDVGSWFELGLSRDTSEYEEMLRYLISYPFLAQLIKYECIESRLRNRSLGIFQSTLYGWWWG
jgi:hypothetical protein